MGRTQEEIVLSFLPTAKRWAVQFASKKSGYPAKDIEDYIQCAYFGLYKYVKRNGEITHKNIGELRLCIKREMFDYTRTILPLNVPRERYRKYHMYLERRVSSLDELMEMLSGFSNFESGDGEALSFKSFSTISPEERIDVAMVAERLPHDLQQVFHLLQRGDSISEISEILKKSYSSTHRDVCKIRRALKESARPDFLIPETEEAEVCADE